MKEFTITPLGTVSPYPKGEMNCPGFLINYQDQNILLDCGSGIARLMTFPNCLENLTVIITHYHNDHFSDIGALQYASYVYHARGVLKDKIKVYLPKNEFNGQRQGIISNQDSYAEYFDITNDLSINIGDLTITFHDNKSHTIESFMVSITNQDKKIVYTSDVGISNIPDIVDFSMNADLLISESSLLNSHNPNITNHLHAEQAANIAKSSNSKKLLLTHFWPEEDKNNYLEEAKVIFSNVSVAIEGKKIIIK